VVSDVGETNVGETGAGEETSGGGKGPSLARCPSGTKVPSLLRSYGPAEAGPFQRRRTAIHVAQLELEPGPFKEEGQRSCGPAFPRGLKPH
jgi:hypothetical protein